MRKGLAVRCLGFGKSGGEKGWVRGFGGGGEGYEVLGCDWERSG